MNWQWRSGEGIQQLVLCGGHGLSKREVGFGFVDSTNCAYDSWNRQEVGVYESGIEAKRNLIRHFVEKITAAPEDSKVRFDEGYIEGLEDAVKRAYMFIDKYGVVYDESDPRHEIQQNVLEALTDSLVTRQTQPINLGNDLGTDREN